MSGRRRKRDRKGTGPRDRSGPEALPRRVPGSGSAPLDRRSWLLLASIVLLTVLAYLPSLGNGFTNWDDDLYVTANPLVQRGGVEALRETLTEPVAFNYHPLTVLSLRLNYLVSGLDPGPYHLTNLLLHLLNVVLVFRLVHLLTGGKTGAASFVALFFAVHPMHVESVAWISERKDVLYAAFLFLSLIFYVRYVTRGASGILGLVPVFVCALLALLSKPAAVILPLLLLLVDYYLRRPLRSRVLLEKLPFVVLSGVFGAVTLGVQSSFVGVTQSGDLSLPKRLLVACYGLTQYLVKAVVPTGLSALHPYPDLAHRWPLGVAAAPVVVLLVAGLVVWSRRFTRAAVFGSLFFLASLILVLQVFSIGLAAYAERYSYVPYVGLFFTAAVGIEAFLGSLAGRPRLALGVRGLVAAAGLAMAVVTFSRVQVWKDSGTLWSDVIRKYPAYGRAYLSRGTYFMTEAGDDRAARRDLDRAVELSPANYLGFYNRGILRERQGDLPGAMEDFTRAIAANPAKAEPYTNRAGLRFKLGDYEGAVSDYDAVVRLGAGGAGPFLNRAGALYKAGRYDEAAADYRRGLGIDPSNEEAQFFKGVCEYRAGRNEAAVASLTSALALDPADGRAFAARARAYAALGRRGEALRDALQARDLGQEVEPAFLQSLQ